MNEQLLEKINETKGAEKTALEKMYKKLAEKSSETKGTKHIAEAKIWWL